MRKLCLILLALTISVTVLAATVAPVIAGGPVTPPENKPVAWVDSQINTTGKYLKDPPAPFHVAHSLHAKVLADGSVAGVVVAHDYVNGITNWFTDFDQEQTRFYDGTFLGLPGVAGNPPMFPTFPGVPALPGARVAQVVVHNDQEPGMPPFHMTYLIVDYGEPATLDWHMVLYWLPDFGMQLEAWYPVWNFQIPYKGDGEKPMYAGNANVVITDAY